MAELTLEVSRREKTGKEQAKKLRQQGKIPAIVYGGHRDPVPVSVDLKVVSELVKKSEHGVRSIFLLEMAGSDQKRHAMIKDVTINPISRKMIHIDFVRVMMDEKVKTVVPVHLTGTAKGVKEGGLLDWQVREVHIECLPGQIPDSIDMDVSGLEFNHFVKIGDLTAPEGVRILDDLERVLASVHGHKAEEEVAPSTEQANEPEVVKKGKTESE
ncbi:MAG: 50S ribosomal protein L25 [Acidobacteria bacterium]|nr:50S ribosomal protein L25 [Acidobacteriota bacterium]